MKLSIITPSYNQSEFITKTLDSVLSQNCSDVEYIVMDGGSTDGTLAILKKYGKVATKDNKHGTLSSGRMERNSLRSKTQDLRSTFYWLSKKDKGQVDAINKGLKMAKGDIFGYINSDDYYEPGALNKVVSFFDNHPDAMWLTGDCRIVDEKGREKQIFVKWYKRLLRYFPLLFVLPILNPIAQPSTFWRREAMEKVGYFDENLHYAFDYDFWLRLIKFYPPCVISDVLSSFRIHKRSKGGKEYYQQFKEELKVVRRYTSNRLVLWLHTIHNQLIVLTYSKIK